MSRSRLLRFIKFPQDVMCTEYGKTRALRAGCMCVYTYVYTCVCASVCACVHACVYVKVPEVVGAVGADDA